MIITVFWLFSTSILLERGRLLLRQSCNVLVPHDGTNGTMVPNMLVPPGTIIYNFNSISNKSRLELNVRQNGTIHEIQETHHVFSKKKKKKKKTTFFPQKKKKKKKKKKKS